jgi:hypothetical protein
MRQQAAILFLILHFFASTELHQLVRMPVLLTHFSEHKASTSSLSFFEFLSLHYGDVTNTHESQNAHDQLPFKSNCEVSLHALWVTIVSTQEIPDTQTPVNQSNKTVLPSFVLPCNDGNNIWQPPKV